MIILYRGTCSKCGIQHKVRAEVPINAKRDTIPQDYQEQCRSCGMVIHCRQTSSFASVTPDIARYANWSTENLREYYGLGKNAESRFRRRLDFVPGNSMTLSEAAPRQFHRTAKHPGGELYVHLSRGGPDLRGDVVNLLDGTPLPYALMKQAYEHVREVDLEAWLTVEAVSYRTRHQTIENVAAKLNITRSAIYKRIERAMESISDFLDRELEAIVSQSEDTKLDTLLET